MSNQEKNKYNNLINIKQQLLSLNKEIEELEQEPVVRKYLDLKHQLENEKSHLYYNLLTLSNLNDVKIEHIKKIYVYIGTYNSNEEKNKETYDELNSVYILYRNIGLPSEEARIKLSSQEEFEQQNIVLYPPNGVNVEDYFTKIRKIYLAIASKQGEDKALEKVLHLNKNNQVENYIDHS